MKSFKKAGCVLLTLLCLMLILSVAASAEEYAPAVFKTTEFEAKQGEMVSTTLYLEENSNLIDFEFQLAYDTELVELQSAVQDSELLGDMEITLKEGAVHISYTRTSANLTKRTNLAVLTFRVNENVGPERYDFLRLDESYHCEAHTMIGETLYALPIETGFAPLNIYNFGDVNLSQSVSIADVTQLRQYLAEMRTLSDYQLSLADAYYDREISIADAVRIQQYLANHEMQLGNRVNVTFLDKDQAFYCIKSVVYGESLSTIPALPTYSGYYGGMWSTSPDSSEGTDFQNLESSLTVYAVYKKDASEAVTFYKERLTDVYYAQPELTGSLKLVSKLTYQDGYTADIYWSSSNSAILNASTGAFSKPSYDSTVTLTATIISYLDGSIEAQDYISFEYTVEGEFLCPTKADIEVFLSTLFTDTINTNMTLPSKVTDDDIASSGEFIVRLDWVMRSNDGEETSVVQLERRNEEQTVTLIATATFNGVPLEGDGKIYFDNVKISSVSMAEVRSYLITEIAANTGVSVTDGETFWSDDTKYGCRIKWISGNHDVATIENNVISIKDVVNGTSLPITVEATYTSGDESKTITLSYTMSVVTDNALLIPGTNIDATLYNALKAATGVSGNLTTDALKNVKFVYLDLSAYPEIEDLSALTYCTNLRVLNISGLNLNETSLSQICTLTKLEALIANHCGIESFTVGGEPVLDKMINLKMLDLAHNNLTSLDSVLSKDNRYGQLEELYLNDNQLTDISALCEVVPQTSYIYNSDGSIASTHTENVIKNRAPMLRFLLLDHNHLDDDDLAAFGNFEVLKYLSLGENHITSVSNLKDIRTLLELHLQGNQIEDIRDLRYLTHLQSLYLSHNNIRNVFSGAKEVNVSYLRYLTELEILYLNDNCIEDISDLGALTDLMVLNVNNNQIQDLSVLADKGSTLVELYAENNEIASFSFVQNLTGLTRLMLSGNGGVYESALNSYLCNLTELRTLTLSGKDLRDLGFLTHLTKLVRLDVADCNIPAYSIRSYSISDSTLTVSDYTDNISAILSLKSTLKYLNISNNGVAYGTEGIAAYLNRIGEAVSIDQVHFSGSSPATFDRLYEMTNLKVLYADNLADPVDASHLFSVMSGIQYLSMENCGIESTTWLSKFRNLVYVDLAGNYLTSFDLGSAISLRSRATLEYLYIDSRADCAFSDAFAAFDGNVLKEFSAANVQIGAMDNLPDMGSLEYLNLAGTGITSLTGDNPDFDGWFNLSRYQTVKKLDISGLQADIDEVSKLDGLETLYAIGDVEDAIFLKNNLLSLYSLYNKGIDCYLYSYNSKYVPKAETEGGLLLGTLKDYSCDLTVSADGVISSNNPILPESINGFDITWTVSNDQNYAVLNNQISVVSYENIDDETITLTASIHVYPDQAPVTRSYEINTTILRADQNYIAVTAANADDYMKRSAEFTYDVVCVNAETDGFSGEVGPVYTDITYSYAAMLADGTVVPYTNIITETGEHTYQINADAPLNSRLTLTIQIGHRMNGTFIADKVIEKVIQIVSETYTVTFHANGGSVQSLVDGSTITSMAYPEESVLFENISVVRPGYLFNGWFTDEGCTELYWSQTMADKPIMPSNDLELYASWTAYSFSVYFDANGGTVSTDFINVLVGTPYGELPVPAKPGHTFAGWYTDAENGQEITASSIVELDADQTLYAHWTVNDYTVTFDAAGGTIATGSKTVTYGSTYGELPTPTRAGFSFNGWYTAESGGAKIVETSVVSITSDQTLFAQWTANSYTVSWSTGTGYTISVSRTSSPNVGASTGTLSSGATVYYGDVLSVSYTAAAGYSLGSCGSKSITVTGNVTSSTIYATASANNYTYSVVYKSSNGTSLGSTTATYAYGTTNTLSAPAFSGYATPSSQSVKWDSTTAKTITFVYSPNSVAFTKKTGTSCTSPTMTYSAQIQYQNRTSSSVQIRVAWTDTISAHGYNVYGQVFSWSCNGVNGGSKTVVPTGTWQNSSSSARSATGYSSWITIPVSATTTSVSVSVYHYQINYNGTDMTANYGASGVNATWTIPIPTY